MLKQVNKLIDLALSKDLFLKMKSDLIIINSNKNDIQINLREQETINYNLKRIMHALLSLNKNGNLVCKFYETFTLINLKLIYYIYIVRIIINEFLWIL